ncbi:MAG: class I SAM-dependent methyltransferase [Candidatus Corynebacterium faecigallinarum]
MTFPAESYEVSFGTLCSGTVERMLADTSASGGEIGHLDLGCGTGGLAAAAVERGRDVTVVDSDPAMVARTRKRVPLAATYRASALELPLGSGTFDVVTANFLVNHLPDPRRGMAEIARVLRPGGRAAVTIWPTGSLAWDWEVTPSDLWRGVSGGVGTAGRTFLAQTADVQERAEREFSDRAGDDTLSFAMTAAYVVAERRG